MRRIFSLVLAVLLISAVSVLVFAQEEKSEMAQEQTEAGMMTGEGMMKKGTMMHKGKTMGMHPMHGMMKAMMAKSLVATEDGGVVVMVGNKLLKYDKYLNLKKEVEIEIDMEGMHKMMMQMKEKCPMSKKMRQESETPAEGSIDE